MANSRLITSDIWADDWFGPLPFFEQTLWIGLFSNCADDQGRLLDNPILIRAAVFPYKDVPVGEIDAALTRFAQDRRLLRYTADGKRLIQLLNWWEHQRPQWAQPSKWPAPAGWVDAVRTRLNGRYIESKSWKGAKGFATEASAPPDGAQAPLSGESEPESPDAPSGEGFTCTSQVAGQDPDPNPDPIHNPTPIDSETTKTEGGLGGAGAASSSSLNGFGPYFASFQNNIGLVSGTLQAGEMREVLEELTRRGVVDWWDKALKIAVDNNKRSWAYMRSILDNCVREGHPPMTREPTLAKSSAPQVQRVKVRDDDGTIREVEAKL